MPRSPTEQGGGDGVSPDERFPAGDDELRLTVDEELNMIDAP